MKGPPAPTPDRAAGPNFGRGPVGWGVGVDGTGGVGGIEPLFDVERQWEGRAT